MLNVDYNNLPVLSLENAVVGNAYACAGGYQVVEEIYSISEEFAAKHQLCFLDRVKTICKIGGKTFQRDFALSDGRWSKWSKTPWEEQDKEATEVIPF
ncbi:MAG: hypothetical protein IJ516_05540 [Phascolarctobacterium sp.]|nr:hypothetical protein [Phascolarctobacterium sp.]